MSGKFITFEGLDGSGKTTIIRKVIEFLNQTAMKEQFIYTREPGGNQISEAIRKIILSKQNTAIDARTEALLYAAARRQHLVETVLPALDAGQLVLSDRYVDSSLVYQGAGRKIGMQKIAAVNEFATDGLTPDLTIYFEVEPQIGLARIQQNRQDEVNRLDEEQIDFYERVHSGYLKLAKENPTRIKVVDASRSIEEVKTEVLAIIKEFLGLKE